MHAHTYTTHYEEHSVLTADERSYFRTRMINQAFGMLAGIALVFAAVTIVTGFSTIAAAGTALLGSAVFLRSLAQRAEDYMAVSDIYSAAEH